MTNDPFTIALCFVLAMEKGYVNDPDDAGGATNYGITQGTYDDYRRSSSLPPQPVLNITMAEVIDIYTVNYWAAARCPDFCVTHPKLALVHFDTAVNEGVGGAAKVLQETLGCQVDGKIGPNTLAYVDRRADDDVALHYLITRHLTYKEIVD